MIDIEGLPKADVLRVLYNHAGPGQGMARLHYRPGDMPRELAEQIVSDYSTLYFDYVSGRPLKVNIEGNELDPMLYDRDNGKDQAAIAISSLRMELEG